MVVEHVRDLLDLLSRYWAKIITLVLLPWSLLVDGPGLAEIYGGSKYIAPVEHTS